MLRPVIGICAHVEQLVTSLPGRCDRGDDRRRGEPSTSRSGRRPDILDLTHTAGVQQQLAEPVGGFTGREPEACEAFLHCIFGAQELTHRLGGVVRTRGLGCELFASLADLITGHFATFECGSAVRLAQMRHVDLG